MYIITNNLSNSSIIEELHDSTIFNIVQYLLMPIIKFENLYSTDQKTFRNFIINLKQICYQPLLTFAINEMYKVKFESQFHLRDRLNIYDEAFNTSFFVDSNKFKNYMNLCKNIHIDTLFRSSVSDSLFRSTYNAYSSYWEESKKKWEDPNRLHYNADKSRTIIHISCQYAERCGL